MLHPSLVTLDHLEIMGDRLSSRPAADVFGYDAGWGVPSAEDQAAVIELMTSARLA